MKHRVPWLLVLAAFSIAFSAGCAPSDRADTRLASSERYFGALKPERGQVFRFNLGAEPESRDPSVMSGQPDGRVARMLFEGLTRPHPKTLEPQPGLASRWEIAPDGLTYTFHLRPGLLWSDGTPLTSRDFAWSWRRVVAPTTASRSASLLFAIRNAEAFNAGTITDSMQVGLDTPDDTTFVVHLERPTAYFLFLTTYYTFLPVPRHVIERHGVQWTRPENLVGNGAFLLSVWKRNERYEFVQNPRYWDRANVRLERVVGYTVDDLNTCANLYKSGAIDWAPSGYIPSQYIPFLRPFADFRHGPYQGTYFYSVNVTREPLGDARVRRALSLSIDRESIASDLLKRSREPWGRIAPSGYPGYVPPAQMPYDPDSARALLAAAGFPGGRGMRRIAILFNTSEDHRRIAEAIQAMWKRELGIDVELTNQEWGSYLQATSSLQYDVARRSWIGDYLDPNSFLQCLATGDGNNRTGWSNAAYDRMLREAANETDPEQRFAIMARAEALAIAESPWLPIYHYSTNELVKPWVQGIYQTALDVHPLTHVWIDHGWRDHVPIAGPSGAAPR